MVTAAAGAATGGYSFLAASNATATASRAAQPRLAAVQALGAGLALAGAAAFAKSIHNDVRS